MSKGEVAVGLLLVALAWVGGYVAARSPRKPFLDQYRESPMFRPGSRRVAVLSATIFAGFAALIFFAGRL